MSLLKAVTVVSSDKDKSLIKNAKLLELSNSSTDGIIELKELAKSTVVVESVHLLIDGSTLRHEEETLVSTTVVENLNGLQGHVLKAREVLSITLPTKRIILKTLGVVGVDIAVQPDREIALAENTESLLVGVSSQKSSSVVAEGVALLLELGVVVLALVRTFASEEVLGTTTEKDIRTILLGPAVVGHTIEGLVDERTVLASKTSVAGQGNRGGIGKIGGRDRTPSATLRKISGLI